MPDETTVCKFRHLLERHRLGQRMFKAVNSHLSRAGMKVGRGTIVDATIIHAPSSTKNKEKERDPEMHSTQKGGQWYFGMKAGIGADSKLGLVHSVVATAANVHDSQVLPELLHGEETRVWGDSAYQGQRSAMIERAPRALDFTNRRGARNHPLRAAEKAINRTKSRVRSKVEHAFQRRQAPVGFQQSPLPRDREKLEPALRRVRPHESVRRAQQTLALATGVVCLEVDLRASRSATTLPKRAAVRPRHAHFDLTLGKDSTSSNCSEHP